MTAKQQADLLVEIFTDSISEECLMRARNLILCEEYELAILVLSEGLPLTFGEA